MTLGGSRTGVLFRVFRDGYPEPPYQYRADTMTQHTAVCSTAALLQTPCRISLVRPGHAQAGVPATAVIQGDAKQPSYQPAQAHAAGRLTTAKEQL